MDNSVDNFEASVTIPGAEESIQFEARTGHDHDGDSNITWAGSWATWVQLHQQVPLQALMLLGTLWMMILLDILGTIFK